jgi:hypothetical protein
VFERYLELPRSDSSRAVTKSDPIWERPESLRERARFYRAYAVAHEGDRAWALWLAVKLEREAGEIERKQATPRDRPKSDT